MPIDRIISTVPGLLVVPDNNGKVVLKGAALSGAPGPVGATGPAGVPGARGATGTQGAAGNDAVFPVGAIILWSKPLAQIPTGWKLCDGTFGTPDLREKVLRGVDDGIDPGGIFQFT